MIKTENFVQVEIASSEELRSWLEQNHRQHQSVWLVTFKKQMEDKYLSREAVLDELLCFGWIDGVRRKLDDERTMQLVGPRRVHHWANSYKERAARLIAEGRMHPAGLEAIAESLRRGLWNLLDEAEALNIPADLEAALTFQPNAALFFAGLPRSSQRFALRWLTLVKSPAARARRVEKLVDLSAEHQKLPGS